MGCQCGQKNKALDLFYRETVVPVVQPQVSQLRTMPFRLSWNISQACYVYVWCKSMKNKDARMENNKLEEESMA